ncbi:MAG: hypothetical protein ACKOX6_18320 [Bdellovibrio sp.]
MTTPPRIRGKVGLAEDGQGFDGKWFFTIEVTDLYGKDLGEPFVFGPWDTEEIARAELDKAVKLACDAVSKAETGEPATQYLDMKDGGKLKDF